MPILRIDATSGTLTQECALCHREHVHELASLVLGHVVDGHASPDAIPLPACACGARETIQRTWDELPEEARSGHFHAHRTATNRLAHHLQEKGQTSPHDDIRKAHRARQGQAPPDMHPTLDLEIERAPRAERAKRPRA